VRAVKCTAGCAGKLAQPGATVEIDGAALAGATTVTFTGGAVAQPQSTTAKRVLVTLPGGAKTGPLTVTGADGQVSDPSGTLPVAVTATPKSTSGPIATGVAVRKAFMGAVQPPTLSYELNTPQPADVTVTVVRAKGGKTVATMNQGTVEPGQMRSVGWGRKAGRFRFVVSLSGTMTASTAQADGDEFVVHPGIFPIRGKHDFGEGAAAFGAARSGHTHEGQDVFAACGTPLVAARGGRVKINKFQSLAGNYLVIDAAGTAVDQVYDHLRDPALPPQGSRVYTGQTIGYVGDTGDASACHLHFEEWSGPGWYTGGSPFDPRPDLEAWDAYS
jgi:murein DD-endopeptidase MepM/ murein hydrolase activator NlpD